MFLRQKQNTFTYDGVEGNLELQLKRLFICLETNFKFEMSGGFNEDKIIKCDNLSKVMVLKEHEILIRDA